MKNEQLKPSREILFTGGNSKTPELAVFYNIAFFKTAALLHFLIRNSYQEDKKELEKITKSFISGNNINDAVYIKLKDYLWKGYQLNKNSSTISLTEKEKKIITEMIIKLSDIRNFHSHIWHNNEALIFSKELKEFIEDLHNTAMNNQREKLPGMVDEYEKMYTKYKLFDKHGDKYFITQNGRNYFLGFFLTRGEMNRFMKQRKGCKRDDTPEFKIKHLVYKNYCHRDGATRNHYGFEENVLETLPHKDEILKVRQAYKIINYLNDVPLEVTDMELFPLLLINGEKVKDATQIIQFIEENNLLKNLHFFNVKNKEEIVYPNIIQLKWKENDSCTFQIGYTDLYKILLTIIRDTSFEESIYKNLSSYIEDRNRIIEIIGKETINIKDNSLLGDEIQEFYIKKLRADDFTREFFGDWFQKILESSTNDMKKAEKLTEKLSGSPIKINYFDFFLTRNEKPRTADLFIELAVNYLIDLQITPDWLWLTEKLRDSVEVSQTDKCEEKYCKNIPDGHRLAINNGHVLVKYKDYHFALGHRTLKNLLIASLNEKNINNGMFDQLVRDIEKIKKRADENTNIKISDLKILCRNTMPRYMLQILDGESVKISQTELIAKVKQRIEWIIEQLQEKLSGNVRMSRGEKNRQIMRCYKYYDWNYPRDNAFKFLRKDEYQKLSIYHYCLDKNEKEKRKLRRTLLEGIEIHMPREVKQLLEGCNSFDKHFEITLVATIQLLTKWKNGINSMSLEQQRDISGKLGFSSNTTANSKDAARVNKSLPGLLPYEVHPLLVLRAYYANELTESNGSLNLSKSVWDNGIFRRGLKDVNYNYSNYFSLFDDKKTNKKVINKMNQLITKDAVLWQIAQRYLEKCDAKYKEVFKQTDGSVVMSVTDLRNTRISLEFEIDNTVVFVIVFMHQLNDFMFIESKPVLEKVVKYLLKQGQTDERLKEIIKPDRNGTIQIPYTEVITEMHRIYHQSLVWTGKILDWEKKIVEQIPETEKNEIVNNQGRGYARISFDKIVEKANIEFVLADELTKLRNHALHASIPGEWAYDEMLKKDRIKKMLDISEEMFEKRDYFEAKTDTKV